MKINRDNYEAFLLDLLEGRLSVEDQQQLQDFLQLNPDCDALLPETESWILEGSQVPYPGREQLKREFPAPSTMLTDHNFDLFSIARMEGDLNDKQEADHRSMVAIDERRSTQWIEWQQTRLVPEPLLFKGKEKLKHKKGKKNRVIWMSAISAAAAIALLIVLFRMGPVLPQQEFSVQSPSQTDPQQRFDVPDQPEVQVEKEEQVEKEKQRDPSTPGLPVQKSKNSVLFAVKKDHDCPIKLESKKVMVTQDDLQPHSVRVSENRLNTSSLVGEPLPDQIKSLYVPPVPIHLSSLSVAQISEMDLQEVFEEYSKERNFSLWTVANAGIKGINKIAGSDISLLASRDEEGEMSGFQLKSKRFSLTRPLRQEE